jgi:hypothetical protein
VADKTEVLTHDQVIEQVVEAYAERASVQAIAYRLSLAPEEVRKILNDPAIAKRALQTKRTQMELYWVGAGLDRLRDIIEDGSPSQQLQAIRLTKELLQEMSIHEPGDDATPVNSLEANLKLLDE